MFPIFTLLPSSQTVNYFSLEEDHPYETKDIDIVSLCQK